jgi:hypothetical protein
MKPYYKALANQAGFSSCTPTIAKNLEKYAEVIIAECIAVSLQSSLRDDDMGAIIAAHIKEHFEKNNDIQR